MTSPTPSQRGGGGGSPTIQWQREERTLTAPHAGPAATVMGVIIVEFTHDIARALKGIKIWAESERLVSDRFGFR